MIAYLANKYISIRYLPCRTRKLVSKNKMLSCLQDCVKELTCDRVKFGSEYYVNSDNSIHKKSFMYNATKLWLELPAEIKEEQLHFKLFKLNLLSHLRQNEIINV